MITWDIKAPPHRPHSSGSADIMGSGTREQCAHSQSWKGWVNIFWQRCRNVSEFWTLSTHFLIIIYFPVQASNSTNNPAKIWSLVLIGSQFYLTRRVSVDSAIHDVILHTLVFLFVFGYSWSYPAHPLICVAVFLIVFVFFLTLLREGISRSGARINTRWHPAHPGPNPTHSTK